MTDFKAADNGTSGAGNSTDFQAQGGKLEGGAGSDTTIVLELDGRKFTKTDLIKKLKSGDEFIETLKTERAQDRATMSKVEEQLKKQVDMAEVLAKLKEKAADGTPNPNLNTEATLKPEEMVATVRAQVEQGLKADRTAAERSANWEHVTTALTEKYGDATNAEVAKIAVANGLTIAEAEEMAKAKPKVFLSMFGGTKQMKQGGTLHSSSVNTLSQNGAPAKASGYGKAATSKQRVDIYLQRLNELGSR